MPTELINEHGKASWELDKKVPLAIILTILVQFVLGVWYASKLDSRVNFLEAQVLLVQTNYTVLNRSREDALISQTRAEDNIKRADERVDQAISMLRSLLNRSNNLHPEFQNDPTLKAPNQ